MPLSVKILILLEFKLAGQLLNGKAEDVFSMKTKRLNSTIKVMITIALMTIGLSSLKAVADESACTGPDCKTTISLKTFCEGADC